MNEAPKPPTAPARSLVELDTAERRALVLALARLLWEERAAEARKAGRWLWR